MTEEELADKIFEAMDEGVGLRQLAKAAAKRVFPQIEKLEAAPRVPDELRKLSEAATPGPWAAGQHPAIPNFRIVKPIMFASRLRILPEWERRARYGPGRRRRIHCSSGQLRPLSDRFRTDPGQGGAECLGPSLSATVRGPSCSAGSPSPKLSTARQLAASGARPTRALHEARPETEVTMFTREQLAAMATAAHDERQRLAEEAKKVSATWGRAGDAGASRLIEASLLAGVLHEILAAAANHSPQT